MKKPVTEYTDSELNAEADAIARRIVNGKVEGRDAVTVVEMAIRLNRLTPTQAPHPDDEAVDRFAAAMKKKLAQARAKGRGGWQEPGIQQRLSDMLRDHVAKGDPRDVANFCMFLHQRGEGIAPGTES